MDIVGAVVMMKKPIGLSKLKLLLQKNQRKAGGRLVKKLFIVLNAV